MDIIELVSVSSPGDFKAVATIAKEVKGPVIAGLARAVKGDIDACWEAIKYAERPRIHVFLASSPFTCSTNCAKILRPCWKWVWKR